MKKALIGVSSNSGSVAINFSGARTITFISDDYLNLILNYNATPLVIPSVENTKVYNEILKNLDGLILSGGQDIDPSIYGEKPRVTYDALAQGAGSLWHRPKIMAPDIIRDKAEMALFHYAKSKKIPVLGICRGMQLINVAEGGTLNQEILNSETNHNIEDDGWINYHEIIFNTKTKTYSFMKRKKYYTSSVHHQSVNRLGKNLSCVAKSTDGVIEMIEGAENDCFIVGIQGHPEKTRRNLPLYERLFSEFFDICKRRSKSRNKP